MYFCAACGLYVHETSARDHDQSTAHLLAATKAPSLRRVWLPETNCGYQLLRTMGWDERSGLGAKGDGRVTPLATVRKNDRLGLGAAAPRTTAHHVGIKKKRKEPPESSTGAAPASSRVKLERAQSVNKQRDRDIAMEIYGPGPGLEGYEEYLR